jgi:hypothetical protein
MTYKRFHASLSFSGSVVLKENIFSMTSPNFCIFSDYLPFEENLALYQNNLEFFLHKFDWNWPAGFGGDCFLQYKQM